MLKLSLVLKGLDDFQNIATTKEKTINSLDEIINTKVTSMKKRGSIK